MKARQLMFCLNRYILILFETNLEIELPHIVKEYMTLSIFMCIFLLLYIHTRTHKNNSNNF